MPVGINQPSNQIRLTNVSLVRLKKAKKRFEIACYKNKVLEYRSGAEKDLDNVLQIPNVFLSVGKGQTAPHADLEKAFGKGKTTQEIVLEILNKGELQVGEKERGALLERVQREVVDIVAGKVVDPKSKRVYTPGMIEKALDLLSSGQYGSAGIPSSATGTTGGNHNHNHNHKLDEANGSTDSTKPTSGTSTPTRTTEHETNKEEPKPKVVQRDTPPPTWTGVVTTKSSKSQALEAIKALIAHQPIPIARARMRLRITCPTTLLKQSAKPAVKTPNPAPATTKEGDEENDESSTGTKPKSKPKGSSSGATGTVTSSSSGSSTIKDRILSYMEAIESQDEIGQEWEVIGFAEPGSFKPLGEFVGSETRGMGRVEVLDMAAVLHEGE